MKICWDNLEKISYRKDRGEWQDKKYKNIFYIYVDSCMNCNEPFLKHKGKNSKFCSRACCMLGKKRPEHAKKLSGENCYLWKGGYDLNNIPTYDVYAYQIKWCEQVRRNKQDKNILEVKCTYCGKWFIPTINNVFHRIRSLKGKGSGESRFYCSKNCKQECSIYNQRKWPKGFKQATSREVQPELRQLVFKRDDYKCVKCGSTENLHCHHVEGIRWEPLESADIDKCMTVCKSCHKAIHKQKDCGYQDLQCNKIKK